MHPEHRTIGELAYHLWQARGCPEGTAEKDWLDAEKQLRAQRANDTTDRSLQDTFPASDPPASQRPDEPPANADAKWKAAGASRLDVSRVEVSRADAPIADTARAEASRKRPTSARPRRPKSTQGKPSADPPS